MTYKETLTNMLDKKCKVLLYTGKTCLNLSGKLIKKETSYYIIPSSLNYIRLLSSNSRGSDDFIVRRLSGKAQSVPCLNILCGKI